MYHCNSDNFCCYVYRLEQPQLILAFRTFGYKKNQSIKYRLNHLYSHVDMFPSINKHVNAYIAALTRSNHYVSYLSTNIGYYGNFTLRAVPDNVLHEAST